MMKKPWLLCAALCSALGAAQFDPGGVSFDLEKISEQRFGAAGKKQVQGINLLRNGDLSRPKTARAVDGWCSGIWVFKKGNRDKFKAKVKNLPTLDIIRNKDGGVMRMINGKNIDDIMGDESRNFRSSFSQIITLPEGKNRNYRLSFEHHFKPIGGHERRMYVFITRRDGGNPKPGKGKVLGKALQIRLPESVEWSPFVYEFNVPDEARDLSVSISLYGCGELIMRQFALTPAAEAKYPYETLISAMGYLDNSFALANRQAGLFIFTMKSKAAPGELPVDGRNEIIFELPETVEIIGSNMLMGKKISSGPGTKAGFKRWSVAVKNSFLRTVDSCKGDYVTWALPGVMFLANDKPGKNYAASFVLKHDGVEVSQVNNFTLKIIPSITRAPQCKIFSPGISAVSHDLMFHQKRAQAELIKLLSVTGNVMLNSGISGKIINDLHQAGFRYVSSEARNFCNGHTIVNVPPQKKPGYAVYRTGDGKPFRNATCPAAIYGKSEFFTGTVRPLLKRSLANKDGLMSNWEPYRTRGVGCFCGKCKEEFGKFSGLSADKVDKLWPKELMPGGSVRAQAIKFRAWQHARVVKTLNAEITAMGNRPIGFCPEVGIDQVVNYPDWEEEQGEFSVYAYADSLKWLNIWGPYIWYRANLPYAYTRGSHLHTYLGTVAALENFRRRLPQAKTKLTAMPHGHQCGCCIGQPEGLAMDQISCFLAGFDASIVYFFPRGYDHRYWQWLARAAALAAAHEDVVMARKKYDGVTAAAQSLYPNGAGNSGSRYLPESQNRDLLQCTAFVKGGDIVAAVGNFWGKGDVVFKLKVPNLVPDRRYSIIESAFERQFVKNENEYFTGAELSEGILLHAGALRWAFFRITPKFKSRYQAVTADEMAKLLVKRNQANRAAFAFEAELDKKLHAENGK